MRRLALVLVVGGILVACRGAPRGAKAPQPPPPLSAALAAKIQADLVACDAGVVTACRDLGEKLEKAKRFDEAVTAYDHGCRLGDRARRAENDYCATYDVGRMCDPKLCTRCSEETRSDPACQFWQAEVCAARSTSCKYDSLDKCLDLMSARQCGRASYVLYLLKRNDRDDGLDTFCNPEERAWISQSMAFAQMACERAERSPVARQAEEYEGLCRHVERAEEHARNCAEITAQRAQGERDLAAMRAQNMAVIAQSVQQLAVTVDGIAAAKRGYVPATFTPGAAAAPGTPAGYVNPSTGAQWTSPNLALIASLVPGGVKPAAAPAGASAAAAARGFPKTVAATPSSEKKIAQPPSTQEQQACIDGCTTQCAAQKVACEKGGQRDCYLAAACLCRCSRQRSCGDDPAALDRCVSQNEASARSLESDKPVWDSSAPAPKREPPRRPGPARPQKSGPPGKGASPAI